MNLKFPPAVKRALKLKIVNIRIIKWTQNKLFSSLNIKKGAVVYLYLMPI